MKQNGNDKPNGEGKKLFHKKYLIFLLVALLLLSCVGTNFYSSQRKTNEARTALAGQLKNIYINYVPDEETSSDADSYALKAVEKYLLYEDKNDKEVKLLQKLLVGEVSTDDFLKSYEKSVFTETVEFRNCVRWDDSFESEDKREKWLKEKIAICQNFIEKYPDPSSGEYIITCFCLDLFTALGKFFEILSEEYDFEANAMVTDDMKEKFIALYPESYYSESFRDDLKRKKEEQHKEKELQDEKNALGIWTVSTYVDKFNYYTNQKYITNNAIEGIYTSETAYRAKAQLRFLIDSEGVNFKLFQEDELVRGIEEKNRYCTITIKDENDKTYTLSGKNSDDRVKLNSSDSKKFHQLLRTNKTLKLNIVTSDNVRNPTSYETEYAFTINCKGYDYALQILTGEIKSKQGL